MQGRFCTSYVSEIGQIWWMDCKKWALESRLGIPMYYGSDAVSLCNNNVMAQLFSLTMWGLGAYRGWSLIARKFSELNLLVGKCGCIGYPRWGRCYEDEGYSEDTELVRKMTSLVTGLQGTPPPDHPSGYPYVAGRNNVMACAKHFVGDGGTDKGKNEGNTIISYEELENIHMLPYPDCISKGVCTVMASYSSWNGTKMHSHRHLLTDSKRKVGV
ncbi:putative glycosyl hydrolase family protein [Tanacetum coccineum]